MDDKEKIPQTVSYGERQPGLNTLLPLNEALINMNVKTINHSTAFPFKMETTSQPVSQGRAEQLIPHA